MKPHLFVLLFIAVLLVTLGTIAAACGGDEERTLEQYFQQITATQDDFGERSAALMDQSKVVISAATTEEEAIDGYRNFVEGLIALTEDTVDELDKIEPPAEAEEAHSSFVAGMAGVMILLREELLGQLADVRSASELEEWIAELEEALSEHGEQWEEGCFALQDIADANGIDVDLECEG